MELQGLDLFKEVVWVSVSQRVAKLPAGKVEGLKKKMLKFDQKCLFGFWTLSPLNHDGLAQNS